jgi:hypothetical protein
MSDDWVFCLKMYRVREKSVVRSLGYAMKHENNSGTYRDTTRSVIARQLQLMLR